MVASVQSGGRIPALIIARRAAIFSCRAQSSGYSISYVTGTLTVNAKPLTISGFAVNNKTYDSTTAATIASNGSLSGLVAGDSVNLNSGGASATLDNANVGTTHTVTAAGYALASGNGNNDAADYALIQPTATNVTINNANGTIPTQATTLPDTVVEVQYNSPAIYYGFQTMSSGVAANDNAPNGPRLGSGSAQPSGADSASPIAEQAYAPSAGDARKKKRVAAN